VDGQTWEEYAEGLEDRLVDLHDRVHSGAYRAQPSRRVFIPKADGRQRPLGIAALEDKIVQAAVVICILSPIYEEMFLDSSYGFRPKRNTHQALDALAYAIDRRPVRYILDLDIRAFFDRVNQDWLRRFLGHRIADQRLLRLITKWLKAGVMEEGRWELTERGTPQGSVISPILANIYLHYGLDLWQRMWRFREAVGYMEMVRYADDVVFTFQYRRDAERFQEELRDRLDQFGLSMHPEKTHLLEFGRYAEANRKRRGQGRPETFDFLDFTHYCSKTRKGGFQLGRKPIAKRMSRKLVEVGKALRRRMHAPIRATARWLGQVLRGWLQYYAVPTSYRYLRKFAEQLKRRWMRVLRRRSQKDHFQWEQLEALVDRFWPRVRIVHPWPDRRYRVTTQGKSRMH